MLKKALVIVLLFSLRADFGAANGQTTIDTWNREVVG